MKTIIAVRMCFERFADAFVHKRCAKAYTASFGKGGGPMSRGFMYPGHPELPKPCAHCGKTIEQGTEEA
jgi:hypothetical protein